MTAISATSRVSLAFWNDASAPWVAIFWLVRLSFSDAESSSQTSSPFLTLVPSGRIVMMVVDPSTWESTSWFFELSRVPLSLTVIGRRRRLDLVGDDIEVGRGEESPDRLAQSGDAQHRDATKGQQRAADRSRAPYAADALRWLGRFRGGRFSVAVDGVGAEAGSSVFCRENFTEGLPFIIRQDADVAIDGQTGRLISLEILRERDLARE